MSYRDKYIKYISKLQQLQQSPQSGGDNRYDIGHIYKITNKNSRHYDEMGILLYINGSMLHLARIRPMNDKEFSDHEKECAVLHCIISERHINPFMYVNKRSTTKIDLRSLSKKEKNFIKKEWANIKRNNIKRHFTKPDSIIRESKHNNRILE